MASNLSLVNVVAFDGTGNAVIQPLKNWKATYREKQAILEIKCDGYVKVYDLRTQVIAVGVGESIKKVALGKTLGRVALTGLLHGRHMASADLRWGGVDRDEYQEVFMMFDDTTTITMEMDGDEFEDLLKLLPDAAKEDEAQDRAEKLMDKVKAMVADGERVLGELTLKHDRLMAEDAELAGKVEAGESFDERHQARERRNLIARQLQELATEHKAVTYDFAVIQATKALKAKNDAVLSASAKPTTKDSLPKPMAAPAALTASYASNVSTSTATHAKPGMKEKSKTSFMGKVAKLIVWLLGACAGFILTVFLGLLFGSGKMWFTLLITVPLGGWLGLKMLAALMRR